MPTHSSAISDNDFTQGQKPVATPPRKPRPKEFWDAEPGDAADVDAAQYVGMQSPATMRL